MPTILIMKVPVFAPRCTVESPVAPDALCCRASALTLSFCWYAATIAARCSGVVLTGFPSVLHSGSHATPRLGALHDLTAFHINHSGQLGKHELRGRRYQVQLSKLKDDDPTPRSASV